MWAWDLRTGENVKQNNREECFTAPFCKYEGRARFPKTYNRCFCQSKYFDMHLSLRGMWLATANSRASVSSDNLSVISGDKRAIIPCFLTVKTVCIFNHSNSERSVFLAVVASCGRQPHREDQLCKVTGSVARKANPYRKYSPFFVKHEMAVLCPPWNVREA